MKTITQPDERYAWEDLIAKLSLQPLPDASKLPVAPVNLQGHKVSIENMLATPCKDGQRTQHLTTMIGKMLAQHYPQEKALALCHQWNQQNIERLPDDKIDSTFRSILTVDQKNHPERYQSRQALAPLFPLHSGRIDDYLDHPPPPRRWLVNDTIVLGKSGAVVAPGGSSKSQWLLQLAVSVATGLPLAGHWEVTEPGNVIILCAEDDNDEIHRRLDRIVNHLKQEGTDPDDLGIRNRLRVFSTIGIDTLLTNRGTTGEVQSTDIVDRIALMAEKWGVVKLIVLDPASRFRGGEENSNEDATRFVQALETLAQRTGASVLIAHHTGKASYDRNNDPSQAASRGASALTDGLRWQMNLAPASDKQLHSVGIGKNAPAASKHIAATVTKTNYTAYPDPIILERLPNGYLEAITQADAVKREQRLIEHKILTTIAQSAKPLTARALEEEHGGLKRSLKLPIHTVREHLKSMIDQGLLSSGHGKPLVLTDKGKAIEQLYHPATDGADIREPEVARKKVQ